jgi:hypothetical protein
MKISFHRSDRFYKVVQEFFLIDPEHYRFLLVKSFRLLGIPILAVFTIYDFLRGEFYQGLLTAIILFVFVFSYPTLERYKGHLMIYRFAILLLGGNSIVD